MWNYELYELCRHSIQFRKFETSITDEFGGDVKVEGETTPGITGHFEVSVNGTVVHSKKVS